MKLTGQTEQHFLAVCNNIYSYYDTMSEFGAKDRQQWYYVNIKVYCKCAVVSKKKKKSQRSAVSGRLYNNIVIFYKENYKKQKQHLALATKKTSPCEVLHVVLTG